MEGVGARCMGAASREFMKRWIGWGRGLVASWARRSVASSRG